MYVFDIDGTLTIVGERLKYLAREPKDWDAFYDACFNDKENASITGLYLQLHDEGAICITGRRESCRDATYAWFKYHDLPAPDALLMRPDGDHRHDADIKPMLLDDYLGVHGGEVEAIFEDRNSMVKKWRELGYTCLQVADGDF